MIGRLGTMCRVNSELIVPGWREYVVTPVPARTYIITKMFIVVPLLLYFIFITDMSVNNT